MRVTRTPDPRVSIRITDQGGGIHESDLGRIFDPYFTTRRGGTGLGLPIPKNIIEGLGGSIDVSTTPGRGTAIEIDLPAAEPIDTRPRALKQAGLLELEDAPADPEIT